LERIGKTRFILAYLLKKSYVTTFQSLSTCTFYVLIIVIIITLKLQLLKLKK